MEQNKEKSKFQEMWQNLRDGMFYTRKVGCPYCADLQLDGEGKPLVTHPAARKNEE